MYSILNGQGEKAKLINISVSNGDLICLRAIIPTAPNQRYKVICWYTGFILQTFVQQHESTVSPTFLDGLPFYFIQECLSCSQFQSYSFLLKTQPFDFELLRAHSESLHPRGPKQGPISLSANIADMCIPSQVICDSDPKMLDVFDIFEDRSL